MRRALVAAALAVPFALTPGATPIAEAAQPRIYHTITDTTGSAVVSATRGCELTEVFVSSSVAMYAAQPGPVGKQGLTSVFVRVRDTCATALLRAAAGGGTVLFEADAQNGAPLVVDPRLTQASVTTDLPGTDDAGNPVTVHLSAAWTGTGPLEHTTVATHVNTGDGTVSSTTNGLRRPAAAAVSVRVSGRSVGATDPNAVVEQTKWHCIENPRPGVPDYYPCFGFPG